MELADRLTDASGRSCALRAVHARDARASRLPPRPMARGVRALRKRLHDAAGLARRLERCTRSRSTASSPSSISASPRSWRGDSGSALRRRAAGRRPEDREPERAAWRLSCCLAKDEPANARRSIAARSLGGRQPGFLIQHWRALIAQVDIDLYEGSGAGAHARISREAAAIRKSCFTLGQYMRAVTQFARARSAIAASFEAPGSREGAPSVAPIASRASLESEGLPWTSVLASMAHGFALQRDGRREAAVRHLRAAVERADAASMALHAAAARYRLAGLLGSDQGRPWAKAARGDDAREGVRAPERFAGMLLPGRW